MHNLIKNSEDFFIEFVYVIFSDVITFCIFFLTPWRYWWDRFCSYLYYCKSEV